MAELFLKREKCPPKVVDKLENTFFFRNSCRLSDNVVRYDTAVQAKDINTE